MIRISLLILFAAIFSGKVFSQQSESKSKDSVIVKKNINEKSPIKSLSLREYNAYKTGQEMGLTKAAELNGYPGPKYVLQLDKELKLSLLQKNQLKKTLDIMQFKILEMGGFILLQEKKINELFASGKADDGSIIYFTNKIGLYQAELRNAYLQANLKTRRILNPDQIKKYNRIKGYQD